MVDPQVASQVSQVAAQVAAPSFINWSINIYDLVLLGAAAILLYGRLVKVETQISPIVQWWNSMQEEDHRLGRRWTDPVVPVMRGSGKE